jgi:hypothetical protein
MPALDRRISAGTHPELIPRNQYTIIPVFSAEYDAGLKEFDEKA